MNRIFYIMGKSSSGKDSIYIRLLKELDLLPIVLYTTRPMRENETEGKEYHFVDKECFDSMFASGEVIEERIYNTVYGEWIYFTSEKSIHLDSGNCIGIGTLESYLKIRKKFGDAVVPIYIEVEDGERIIRAVHREQQQPKPKYTEMCRRFIADSEDFSEEKIKEAEIKKRFSNSTDIENCITEIKEYIKSFEEQN